MFSSCIYFQLEKWLPRNISLLQTSIASQAVFAILKVAQRLFGYNYNIFFK